MSEVLPLTLAGYAHRRDALLARIVEVLEADPRVVAAWLSGAHGRGVADAWSDLDLHVAVEDAALAAFLDERDDFYRRFGEPVLVQEEMPSNAMPASRFQLVIYAGPVEVDWTIGPLREETRP
ncbi:MAG TPA: aminoglycoside 6-adenylyltransferase, partial [Thermomicrobiales bacterium]|nr:aminoglycoside 6-adenylyltransferase [Thermomicrobiales bacterium]